MTYFYDTAILVEIAIGNKEFEKYLDEEYVFLNANLAELYYVLLLKYNQQTARFYFDLFRRAAQEFPQDLIADSMTFRHANKKSKFSYTDCFGYVYALQNGCIFLTRDAAFRGMKNTEVR